VGGQSKLGEVQDNTGQEQTIHHKINPSRQQQGANVCHALNDTGGPIIMADASNDTTRPVKKNRFSVDPPRFAGKKEGQHAHD
jgi:hypothetical protein